MPGFPGLASPPSDGQDSSSNDAPKGFPGLAGSSPASKPSGIDFGQLLEGGKKNLNATVEGVKYYGTHPMELMNAITYPVGRAVEGGISGALGPHNGTNPVLDTMGSAFQGATHPGARVALDRSVERRLGLKPNPQMKMFAPLSKTMGAFQEFDAGSGATKALLDTLVSLSTRSGVDAAVEEIANLPSYMSKYLDGAYMTLKSGQSALNFTLHTMLGVEKYRNLMSSLDTFYKIKKDLKPEESARIRGESGIRRSSDREGKQRAQSVLKGHEETLKTLGATVHGEGSRVLRRQTLAANPATKPIIDELDRVSWVEGTQQVREKMLQHKYVPAADVANLPPGNTLHHWDETYFPTQATNAADADFTKGAFGSRRKKRTNAASYNLPGGDGSEGDDILAQIKQRIESGYRNAANAQFQRQSIRAGQRGALPETVMSEVDINNKQMETGNVFQPYSDAIQKVKLRDIREGNSPHAAFADNAPPSSINRDIQTGNGGEIRSKVKLKPLERAQLRAQIQLDTAKGQASRTSSSVSKFGLDRQKAVSDAATRSGGQARNEARRVYNEIANADVQLDKRISGIKGGSRTIDVHPSRNQSSGPGAIPGIPKLAAVEKAEQRGAEAIVKAKESTPEHRKLIAEASDALAKARTDFNAAKSEIYSKYPRKPGKEFPPEVGDQLRVARSPLVQAESRYKEAVGTITSERKAFADSKESPELQSKLAESENRIKHERDAYIEKTKGQKKSKEDKLLLRTELDKAISARRALRDEIQSKRAALTDSQNVEIAASKKKQAQQVENARKSDKPQDFVTPSWSQETQTVTSAAGQRARNAIDPVFKAAIRNEKKAGNFVNKIHKAAIGGNVERILSSSKTNVAAATRRLVASEGRLIEARTVNETVDRISGYLEEELARSGKLTIPHSVEELLYERDEKISGMGFDKIANVFRDATFAIPYVHGWNIITQTLTNGMGVDVVAKGMSYSRKIAAGDLALKAAQAELKSLGQAAEYSGHDTPLFSTLPRIGKKLAELSEKGQQTLDHIDHGIKIAVMEKLKATEGLSGNMLGARIEDIYGNPEGSGLSNFLRAIGGFFPSWRVNVLPRTIANGFKSEKGRKAINQMNWSQNFLTQESEDPENRQDGATPTKYNLFPALNEGEELIFGGPYGAANYMTSTGTLGLIPEVMQRKSESGSTALSRSFLESFPFASDVSRIGGDVAKRDTGAVLQDLIQVLGPRVTAETVKELARKLKYYPQTYEGL